MAIIINTYRYTPVCGRFFFIYNRDVEKIVLLFSPKIESVLPAEGDNIC